MSTLCLCQLPDSIKIALDQSESNEESGDIIQQIVMSSVWSNPKLAHQALAAELKEAREAND